MIDWNFWIDPQFGPAGIAAVALVTAWTVLRAARATPARIARQREAVERRPDGRVRVHRRHIVRQWLVCVVALLPLLTDDGVDAADYGLRDIGPDEIAFAVVALALMVLILWARNHIFATRAREGRPVRMPAARTMRRMSYLLPRTGRERRWGVGTAVTAGIVEEIIFRGLLYAAGIALLGLDPWIAALASAALFGLSHRHQGLTGVLGTGLIGLCFTVMYVLTGSLLLPIALHVAIDLAAFALPVPLDEPAPAPAPPAPPPVAQPASAPAVRLRIAAPEEPTPA